MPKFDVPSTKDNHVFSDTAALNNNAAKDDLVCTLKTEFSVQDLLANDPGSAAFVGFGDGSLASLTGVSFNPDTQMITVNWATVGEEGFDYTIRMANGTYSTAHVGGVTPHAGANLFLDSFENYTPVTNESWGYTVNLGEYGWTSSGANAEICPANYTGPNVGGDGHWLDTQATGGAIDITHTVADANLGKAQITLSVATEVFGSYSTGGTLDVYWNGVKVDSIDPSELTSPNAFQNFTYIVNSDVDGVNDLRIVDTAAATNVGFAIDSVTVNDWVCA